MAYRGSDSPTKRQARFYILSIVVSVLLSFVAIISYVSGFSGIFTNAVKLLCSPLESLGTAISSSVASVGNYFGDIDALHKENIRLQEENNLLREQYAKTEAIRKENENLYTYLELTHEFSELSLTNAKIVSKGSSNFSTVFTIDKGSISGIKKGMPVLSSGSVLGVVTDTGLTSSRVISLANHNSSAGVYILRTGLTGILEGDFSLSAEEKCRVSEISADADVVVGDLIYTTGFGDVFPKDLFVGTVTEILRDANSHTLTLIVTPKSTLSLSSDVMVVTSVGKGDN